MVKLDGITDIKLFPPKVGGLGGLKLTLITQQNN